MTEEAVREYQKRSEELAPSERSVYAGRMRELVDSFRSEYELSELEAFNILQGKNVSDYLEKYSRISKNIPLIFTKREKKGGDEDDF